jgi:hypothetical protein
MKCFSKALKGVFTWRHVLLYCLVNDVFTDSDCVEWCIVWCANIRRFSLTSFLVKIDRVSKVTDFLLSESWRSGSNRHVLTKYLYYWIYSKRSEQPPSASVHVLAQRRIEGAACISSLWLFFVRFAAWKFHIPDPYEFPSFSGTKDFSCAPLRRERKLSGCDLETWVASVVWTNTPHSSARERDVCGAEGCHFEQVLYVVNLASESCSSVFIFLTLR